MKTKIILLVLFFLSAFTTNEVSALIDITPINETINDLRALDETPTRTINIFYPIFFMVLLFFFMVFGYRTRYDRVSSFPLCIGAVLISIVLTFIFLSPIEYDLTKTTIRETIDEFPNGTATNLSITEENDQIILIPNEKQFRFVLSSLFTVLTLYNGLFSIFVITDYYGKRKRES